MIIFRTWSTQQVLRFLFKLMIIVWPCYAMHTRRTRNIFLGKIYSLNFRQTMNIEVLMCCPSNYFFRPMAALVEAIHGSSTTGPSNTATTSPTTPLSVQTLDSLTVHTKMSLIHNIVNIFKLKFHYKLIICTICILHLRKGHPHYEGCPISI